MPKLIRQFLDAVTHSGPSYNAPVLPRRGDAVEAWLKAQRDEYYPDHGEQWSAIDDLLDEYRLHADTGTPLHEHVCEGGNVDDCAGCYDAKNGASA
jgi:hypothetical protein